MDHIYIQNVLVIEFYLPAQLLEEHMTP